MTAWLRNHGHQVNRKRVRRLMQLIGLEAIYRRPNTSKPNPGHKVYPYLLRGLEINRVNQVWATDITYIPMARGYVNRCVNDIRRRPSQPLIQWRFHPHTVHRGRRLRSTQGLQTPEASFGDHQHLPDHRYRPIDPLVALGGVCPKPEGREG